MAKSSISKEEPYKFVINDQPELNDAIQNIGSLQKKLHELEQNFNEKIETAKKDLLQSKNEYIAIFGIFASIITFLGIEVQAFNKLNSFAKIGGFSLLLMSIIVTLMFCIDSIITTSHTKFYKNSMFWIATIFLLFAMVFFYYDISNNVLWWHIDSKK